MTVSEKVRSNRRLVLAKLSRAAKSGLISVPNAAKALNVSASEAAIRLASLMRGGWAKRIRRGLYMILPSEIEPGQASAPEDAWILAVEAFSPCYIGGWSAAEHWGLTEQMFRSTLIVTSAPIRSSSVTLANHEFRLFKVPRARLSGTVSIWRGSTTVLVSSRERTIVDCLRAPQLCGGIRHLAHMMNVYWELPEKNMEKLLKEATTSANGAAWKRLGYLSELLWHGSERVQQLAKQHISAGYSLLDPDIKQPGKLLRRWNLKINAAISVASEAA
ncbi:MAG: type IV toxin-antitoxin system AbiEi family antitoxin [Terracidiphilus sp.]|jgi:predicted transcriptional regulator of viral defense system